MTNLCLIPARGGSKRIPRKNIKDFMGKPMISYPIQLALQSGIFDEIMVSTDDAEIADLAISLGAKVPFMRSEHTSHDTATTASVIEEVLLNYQEKNMEFEYTCCLYPCTPLLSINALTDGLNTLENNDFDTVLSAVLFAYPVQRALIKKGNNIQFLHPENALKRTQDLEPMYHDAGQFYWLRNNVFLKSGQVIGKNCGCVILSELESQDIDSDTDWKMAECKFNIIKTKK